MSETVQIALITFASAFLGVVVGAYANYMVSKLGVQADRAKLLHDEKKLAYSQVLAAYFDALSYSVVGTRQNEQLGNNSLLTIVSQFDKSYSLALLLAPSKVQIALDATSRQLAQSVEHEELPENADILETLISAMREDLLSFSFGATKK